MDAITKKWRGSFTVEATVVVSFLCILMSLTILLGFYGHDRAIIKSTANDMAIKGALWRGRYVSPITYEVAYGAMKRKEKVPFDEIEALIYAKLERRLLLGKINSVQVTEKSLQNMLEVEITVDFKLWKIPVSCTVQSSSHLFESKDLPRNIEETGEKE